MNTIDTVGPMTEWDTKMESYTFFWRAHWYSWKGHEISVLLPEGTQYSRGMVRQKTEDGERWVHDFVDAVAGIPVPRDGDVEISLSYTTTAQKVTETAYVTFQLRGGVTKEYFTNLAKEKGVQILSEDENSVICLQETACWDLIRKIIFVGDLMLQVTLTKFFFEPLDPKKELLERMVLV